MDKGKLYTLIKRKDTEELHLFNSDIQESDNKCYRLEEHSMCRAMQRNEGEKNAIFACKDEIETRTESAKIGRAVCGNCIAQLYTTYE